MAAMSLRWTHLMLLRPIYIQRLRRHCDIAVSSLQNLIYCFGVVLLQLATVTSLWCRWGIVLWAIREQCHSDIAVARCKWALNCVQWLIDDFPEGTPTNKAVPNLLFKQFSQNCRKLSHLAQIDRTGETTRTKQRNRWKTERQNW